MSPPTTTIVAAEARRVVALLRRLGVVLALAVALIPSVGYVYLALDHERADFAAALDRRASAVTRMIYASGRYWQFEQHRLKDVLEPHRSEPGDAHYRAEVVDGAGWALVAENGTKPGWPRIEVSLELRDGDRLVGRLVGVHGIAHVVEHLFLVVLASAALGTGVLLLIRRLAIPLVERSLGRLEAHEAAQAHHSAELERVVDERTRVLRETNERLNRSLSEIEQRQRENEQLATIAQKVDSGIVIMGPSGLIEWVNPGFTAMMGYTLDDVVGRHPASLLHGPETDPAAVRRMADSFRRGESFSVEIRHYTKAGEAKWIELTSTILRDERGAVQRCIAIGRDVSDRKRQEQRLAEALEREREINQRQRRFVSAVSHEFRTPLTIIDGAAQRLARNATDVDPADIRERVSRIRRAVARMGELIETSLSAARLESDAIERTVAPLDLGELVAAVVERINGISPGFDIRFDRCADPAIVKGDPRLLDQVMTNLLTNAIKYSGESRLVEVAMRRDAADAYLSFRDHGLGIPADEVPKLFTRFFRASTALGLPGTGIGLHLARELVGLHDGDITVASTVGQGSEFTVRLPLASRDGATAPVRAA